MCETLPNKINLRRFYRRKTHINGIYRENMKNSWDKMPTLCNGLVHSLDPDKWMNLSEILEQIFTYASQFVFENDAIVLGNPYVLELALEHCVLYDIIEAKNE